MAHSLLHFTLGLWAAMLVLLPRLPAWERTGPRARAYGRWLAGAYALALWAIIPNLLRRTGLPESFCSGPWMNLFMLHPIVDQLHPGGMLIGEAVFLAAVALQYLLLLRAIARVSLPRETIQDT